MGQFGNKKPRWANMTAKEAYLKFVNKYFWYAIKNKGIPTRIVVICTDAKVSFGRPHVLIQPVCGEGSSWVEAGRLVNPFTEDKIKLNLRAPADFKNVTASYEQGNHQVIGLE